MQLDWEIWLDEHISPIIAKWLSDETGWIVKSSYALQLRNLSEQEVYQRAKDAEKVIIVSQYTDLKNLPQAIPLLLNFNKDIVEINK